MKLLPCNYPVRLTKGQSLVEFALAATLMIFMLVATIDFGLAFFSWITLRDAAQEGATFGSMFPPADASAIQEIENRVKHAATTPIDLANQPPGKLLIDIDMFYANGTAGGTACPGNSVQVKVTYNYEVITPMISTFINSPTIAVSATVTDTILRAGTGVTCP